MQTQVVNAQSSSDGEQARAAARRRAQRLTFANLAALVVLGALAGRLVQEVSRVLQDARAGEQTARSIEPPPVDADPHVEQETPPEEVRSGGLDAGMELAEMLATALPMPKSGLLGQMSAPCPDGIEEINGYCWLLQPLTTTQVKSGVCESEDLYEPSSGWCRAHRAGYRPFRGKRRSNNVVDP